MPLIKVKPKFQLTIPNSIRKEASLAVGDYLEAIVEGDNIVLKPKVPAERDAAVEAAIEAGLRDYEAGRVTPAFSNMKEFKEYLRRTKEK